jgi:hypothetical protein
VVVDGPVLAGSWLDSMVGGLSFSFCCWVGMFIPRAVSGGCGLVLGGTLGGRVLSGPSLISRLAGLVLFMDAMSSGM